MGIMKSAVLACLFLVLASGIAYPFVLTYEIDQMKAEIEFKGTAVDMEITLWSPDYRNQKLFPITAKISPSTKIQIAGQEVNYTELARFNGKQALVSGEIAMYYQDHKKWEEWGFLKIFPIPPEKGK